MKNLRCAICSEKTRTRLLYRANFDFGKLNEKTFSARRIPDNIHYQLNKCQNCGLIFSSPILAEKKIIRFYQKSKFTYEKEAVYLAQTYLSYLKTFRSNLSPKTKILDIGCGNGFFLSEIYKLGIKNVFGIEPSKEAVSKAAPYLKKNIKIDVLHKNIFPKSHFDIITSFQTLDHVVNPNEFVKIVYRMLKAEGIALFVVHDTNGLSVKLFGEKSPIFDIEHIYLFNKKTLAGIFRKNGFKKIKIFNVNNKYPLIYWLKMTPLPPILKNPLMTILVNLKLAKIPLSLAAGNIGIAAYK